MLSVTSLALILVGCQASDEYDLNNETDRAALKIDIQNALTGFQCDKAISLSNKIFDTPYVDNSFRLLYASAYGCKAGIKVYDIIDDLTVFSSGNPLGEFARLFPSDLSDSRLPSAWLAQDAYQSAWQAGAAVASVDQFVVNSNNIGSVNVWDRISDANVYGFFVTMAVIGTTLSRYGSPSASYNQGANLPWTTQNLVKNDLSGVACGLAAGFLNFFDSTRIVQNYLSGNSASSISSLLTTIEDPIVNSIAATTFGGLNRCTIDGFSANECATAKIRLRYRGACEESNAAASFAAGMIASVNLIWL